MKKAAAKDDIAQYIDHTLLKPNATPSEIAKLCQEAVQYGFKTVCVNPMYVSYAKDKLEQLQGEDNDTGVGVCGVVGFPLGATTTSTKAFEAFECINSGADEVDMVLAVGKLKSKDFTYVLNDISAVADECHKHQVLCKVILETGLLTPEEKQVAAKLCVEAKVDFVKTSTGFSTGGATVDDVALLYSLVHSDGLQVKASGGIKTRSQAQALLQAGATRLGMSSSVSLFS